MCQWRNKYLFLKVFKPNYLYHQSIVNYRIPVKEDGTLGNPEIVSKFTRDVKGTQKNKPTPKKQVELESQGEEEYL